MVGVSANGTEHSTLTVNQPGSLHDTRRKPRQRYSNTGIKSEDPERHFPAQRSSKKKRRSEVVRAANERPLKSSIPDLSSYEVDGHTHYVCTLHDKTELRANDCIYLICEPPGEPYYLGRIMEFTKLSPSSVNVDAVRINWFYRPRDIQRQHSDSRLLFATMHSDVSPLTSIRGKCIIKHKTEVADVTLYRKQADCFYFERLFDKYMRRQYEVIPVSQVINVPEQVKHTLQKRWKFVIVEVNRVKELAMDHRACKRCADWCASKDSVRCAICKSDFHMQCVQPPLPRKPTRGFAWSCTACSRAEARRVDDAQQQGMLSASNPDAPANDASPKSPHIKAALEISTASDHNATTVHDKVHEVAQTDIKVCPASRIGQWPYRYLGIHCNINDVIDHDDRIYPRAVSRIGPRHQAHVPDWPGRPFEYFERAKRAIKRTPKAMKGKRSDERAALEGHALASDATLIGGRSDSKGLDLSADSHVVAGVESLPTPLPPAELNDAERPPWVVEKPANYLARGEGKTADLMWFQPSDLTDEFLADYLDLAQEVARKLKVEASTPNFFDAALKALCDSGFDKALAMKTLSKLTNKTIERPIFSSDERARFEQSVLKHGSDLAQVAQDVKTKSVAECVRFYYTWKKSPTGSQVWANSEARKPKNGNTVNSRDRVGFAGEVDKLGDSSDDSAYSVVKATRLKKSFQCKYCDTTTSSKWRRAPGTASARSTIVALCNRCADLWRKYAVQWESPEEIYKKVNEKGARGRKRKFEEELVKELPLPGDRSDQLLESVEASKPRRLKKSERDDVSISEQLSPCAVCHLKDEDTHRTCSSCKLYVHITCYGIEDRGDADDWLCDCCTNDRNSTASTDYACVLCPVRDSTHSGSSRGALKRTAGNNWAHITCSTFIADLYFGDSQLLQPVEGISALSLHQWQQTCTICNTDEGHCVTCSSCSAQLHVECAHESGCLIGFDLQPVKSSQSRRDSLALVRLGTEAGLMAPVIHCLEHTSSRTTIHHMHESVAAGSSVLSLYIKTYKSRTIPVGRTSRITRPETGGNLPAIPIRLLDHHPTGVEALRPSEVKEEERCTRCSTHYSAHFYKSDVPSALLCHKCHWTTTLDPHTSVPPALLDPSRVNISEPESVQALAEALPTKLAKQGSAVSPPALQAASTV